MLTLIGLLRFLLTLGNIWQETAGPHLSKSRREKKKKASPSSPTLHVTSIFPLSHLSLHCPPHSLGMYWRPCHTYLAVGVRVRTAHHGSFVFKDLPSRGLGRLGSFSSQRDPKSTLPNDTLWKQECQFPEPKLHHPLPAHPGAGVTLQTCTQGYWAPRSSVTEAHTSMTVRISGIDMSGSVISDQGWKHKTLLSSAGGRNDRNMGLGGARGRVQPQCSV